MNASLSNADALLEGCINLGQHIRNLGQFGVPATVAINKFSADTDAEIAVIQEYCRGFGVEAIECRHWAEGGKGATDLAEHVVHLADSEHSQFRPLYDDDLGLWEKARHIARTIYGADDIIADKKSSRSISPVRRWRLWQLSGLHGQDTIQFLDGSESAGRAQRSCRAHPGGSIGGRCRVRRCRLRNHHDHAGPAEETGRQ